MAAMNEADRQFQQTEPKLPADEQPLPDEQTLPIDPEEHESEDKGDEASDDSFPASDPPSFTRSTTSKD